MNEARTWTLCLFPDARCTPFLPTTLNPCLMAIKLPPNNQDRKLDKQLRPTIKPRVASRAAKKKKDRP